jgi:hypothetical protein
MINASYRHVPTVGTNTFLSNLLLQFDVDISQYVFQSTCTLTRFVSDNSEERRLLNKLPMMLNGLGYRIDPNTYIHATEGIRLKPGEHYRLQFEMTITEHMVHTVRTALSRVRVSYGLFLRANPALGTESLVSVPIVNEEYFQNGEPQRFELNTGYLNTTTEPRRLLIIGNPDMKFDGDYPAFVLPTNIADSVQHVYDLNSICTYFEVAIPVLTEQADFINTDLEMFFADVYEGGELIARMHFDARIVNNTLRLVFSARNTKLEVLNMLHLNIGLMRLQKNDSEYIPQLNYYLYHVGGQIPISLDKFDVISHYAPIQCFIVNSPGMINLATESYLTLRCEEIENHIRGSYNTKEHSPGLGIVNIDVQGYAGRSRGLLLRQIQAVSPDRSVAQTEIPIRTMQRRRAVQLSQRRPSLLVVHQIPASETARENIKLRPQSRVQPGLCGIHQQIDASHRGPQHRRGRRRVLRKRHSRIRIVGRRLKSFTG